MAQEHVNDATERVLKAALRVLSAERALGSSDPHPPTSMNTPASNSRWPRVLSRTQLMPFHPNGNLSAGAKQSLPSPPDTGTAVPGHHVRGPP